MGIDFFPSSTEEEIQQNIITIVGTLSGSVPLDRGFGIPLSSVGDTLVFAKARLTGQVKTAIATYEPRVEVTGVTFTQEKERLLPVVTYRVKEGVL